MSILKQFSFFDALTQEELSAIHFHTKTIPKNTLIGQAGDPCPMMYFIISGEINMEMITENGDLQTLARFGPGECIGETLIFASQGVYPGDVVCKQEVHLVVFTKEEISRLIMANEKLFHKYATIMADKVYYLTERVRILGHKSLREKITTYLLLQSTKQKSKTIILPMSKEKLSIYLGTIRPSLVRELTNMKEEGLLAFDRKSITLLY